MAMKEVSLDAERNAVNSFLEPLNLWHIRMWIGLQSGIGLDGTRVSV